MYATSTEIRIQEEMCLNFSVTYRGLGDYGQIDYISVLTGRERGKILYNTR